MAEKGDPMEGEAPKGGTQKERVTQKETQEKKRPNGEQPMARKQ